MDSRNPKVYISTKRTWAYAFERKEGEIFYLDMDIDDRSEWKELGLLSTLGPEHWRAHRAWNQW